ncbi:MAG: hypothetical protein ACREO9_01160 [Lysobacterales bacterium]
MIYSPSVKGRGGRRKRNVLAFVSDALLVMREMLGFVLLIALAVGGTLFILMYLLEQLGVKAP